MDFILHLEPLDELRLYFEHMHRETLLFWNEQHLYPPQGHCTVVGFFQCQDIDPVIQFITQYFASDKKYTFKISKPVKSDMCVFVPLETDLTLASDLKAEFPFMRPKRCDHLSIAYQGHAVPVTAAFLEQIDTIYDLATKNFNVTHDSFELVLYQVEKSKDPTAKHVFRRVVGFPMPS